MRRHSSSLVRGLERKEVSRNWSFLTPACLSADIYFLFPPFAVVIVSVFWQRMIWFGKTLFWEFLNKKQNWRHKWERRCRFHLDLNSVCDIDRNCDQRKQQEQTRKVGVTAEHSILICRLELVIWIAVVVIDRIKTKPWRQSLHWVGHETMIWSS